MTFNDLNSINFFILFDSCEISGGLTKWKRSNMVLRSESKENLSIQFLETEKGIERNISNLSIDFKSIGKYINFVY